MPDISGLFIVFDHITQFAELYSLKFLAISSAKNPNNLVAYKALSPEPDIFDYIAEA